jgi:glyoxylase-like metal-dependent hydrolase (beta-lactamase superfamily II)
MQLPDSIQFIERDWLSANHIMFRDHVAGDDVASIVDTGYITRSDHTLAKIDETLAAWDHIPLAKIINTHIHSDHIGCNLAVQRAHPGCSIAVPSEEAPYLVNWDAPQQMLSYADQQAERFQWDETIEAGQTLMLGGETWQCIATPGHDMGSLVLYAPQVRALISADALWENGSGFVVPQALDPKPLAAQRATFKRLAELDVAGVLPGHGPMFRDFSGALKRAGEKLEAFAADDLRIARNVVKGMFIYSMNWRGRLNRSELVNYVKRVGVHRDYNALFFHLSDEAYAQWLLNEAQRTGKVRVDGDVIIYID